MNWSAIAAAGAILWGAVSGTTGTASRPENKPKPSTKPAATKPSNAPKPKPTRTVTFVHSGLQFLRLESPCAPAAVPNPEVIVFEHSRAIAPTAAPRVVVFMVHRSHEMPNVMTFQISHPVELSFPGRPIHIALRS